MAKQKTIINIGNLRLRQYDNRNWILEEYRAADPSHRFTKSADPEWRSCERYFQSVTQGLNWILEHDMLTDGGEYDLEGAIKRIEYVSEYLAEAARTHE